MSIEKQWCLFSAGAVLVLGLSASTVGCRADTTNTETGGNGGEGVSSSSSTSSSSGNTGGAGGDGGSGGSGGAAPTCGGPVTKLSQITDPKDPNPVGKGLPVNVDGLVVMSRKFLVSKSSSGTCLYGVFASAPGLTETAPYSGILVLAKGSPAVIPAGQNTAYCGKISNRFADDPLPGDVIPDDIKPGDVVNVSGTADSFLLNACANEMNGSKVAQKQISFACKFEKTGMMATPPAPHVFTLPEDIAKLGSSTDTAFHDMWGGVKVRIGAESTAVPQADPGGGSGMVVVGDFGLIKLANGTPNDPLMPNVQVGDKLYYRGYDKQACYTGPMFSDLNIKWTAIDGFNYLNYCTWDVEPNNKCVDFNPASEDCSGVVCQ